MERIGDVINSIANERGLDPQTVSQHVCLAIARAAKKFDHAEFEYVARIKDGKDLELFHNVVVVEDNDERVDGVNFLTKKQASEIDAGLEVGDSVQYDSIDTSKLTRPQQSIILREIEFQIERLLEDFIFNKYKSKEGKMVTGIVRQVDDAQNTWIEMDELRAVMPMKNRIKNEKFAVGQMLKAVVKSVRLDRKDGIRVEITRTSPRFLEALLEAEVPEIKDGSVIVKACARIPGKRAKVALASLRPNIDPVGAVVGVKGVRINAVSKEICGENIDVFLYAPQPELLIARSLSPAIINSVVLKDDKRAVATISTDQKSKAIGANGINIRLTTMITGYEIELNETGVSVAQTTQEDANEQGLKNLKALFGDE